LLWGADFGPYTLGGQYWRLVTSSFLHIGFLHLALNMVSLWILGRMVEKLFGAFITCGLYLLTAVGAGLLTLSWEPMRVSAGASGAIFGLDGVLISVLYFGNLGLAPDLVRRALGWVVKIALVNLFYGLRGNVDNMAHLGGLVTGLLAGVFLARTFSSPVEDRVSHQTRILAATALGLLLLLVPVKRAKGYAVELQQAATALEQKDYKSAIPHLQKYLSLKPNDEKGHGTLGYAFQVTGRMEDAAREYERALAIKPDLPWVETNLAGIYWYQQKPAEAVALYQASIARTEATAEDYQSYGAALLSLRRYAEAENALRKALALDRNGDSSKNNQRTHELLATAYEKLGKVAEARQERQLASEFKNSHSEATQATD
jgi:rhomboid protease GluP